METGEPNQYPYGSPRGRFWLYATIFGLALGFIVLELKTGYHVSRRLSVVEVHEPWSWEQVAVELPQSIMGLLIAAALVVPPLEWWIRRKTRTHAEYQCRQ